MSEPQICDSCGENPFSIQVTQVESGGTRVLHLCEKCAAEKGIRPDSSPGTAPLTDFLAQIGQGTGEPRTAGRCPGCGMTAFQLRNTGRLGCGVCYTHFDDHLRGLLRRLHGGTKHVGKVVLPADPKESDIMARAASLRRSLERAVEAEDFESAASLRDQLRQLQRPSGSA
ncbi:MAG: UvrB/UvrC motif-containing protein [Gemmatimonadota bacterium]|jgi:protein arginine kinase activator|nr:UvrB/UvrC motif-containing protein [Gemmatimonadota bacterium]